MIEVYVNGIRQIPGIDYVSGINQLSFLSAPQMGAIISVSGLQGTVATMYGDGTTYLFHMVSEVEQLTNIVHLFEDVSNYYKNPAVAEALERLTVVVALVKENG